MSRSGLPMPRAWPVLAYGLLYAASLGLLHRREGLGLAEPLFVLIVVGVGFTGLAYWTTRGLQARPMEVRAPRREGAIALGLVVLVTVFITWGLPAVRALSAPGWFAELGVLLAKVLVFVGLPVLLCLSAGGYTLSAVFDWRHGLRGHWRPTLVLAGAVLLIQVALGRVRTELPALHPALPTFTVVLALAFLWLLIDVGAVEEIFFRGFLQSRLAAWSGSELVGLVAMAVLFGLAHAPGLYLRPGLMGEAVGDHPSLLLAVGYSIVFTSVTGFYLGVLWLRTRNLWVLAVVHAANDLLPTVVDALRSGYLGA